MNFGEKIRSMREDKDLSQTQVGDILGMSQMKISRMETGGAEPALGDIVAICRFFNVSADYLLELPEGMPYPKR